MNKMLEWSRETFQRRVVGLMVVSEAMGVGDWFRGRLVEEPDVYLEISFESGFPLPGTNMVYFAAFRNRVTRPMMEFQMGYLAYRPTDKEWDMLLYPLIKAIGTYQPMRVALNVYDR